MSDKPLIIYGAGEQGLVVAEAAAASGVTVEGFVDDTVEAGASVGPWTVLGGPEKLDGAAAAVFVGIGNNETRLRLLKEISGAGHAIATVVHPTAAVSVSATVGAGTFVGPQAVVHALAAVADGAIINSGAIVEHHDSIGEGAHIAPGAALCGQVEVGPRALVAANAVILPGRKVGADAVVGAGAVVTRDVPPSVAVVGNPAHITHAGV